MKILNTDTKNFEIPEAKIRFHRLLKFLFLKIFFWGIFIFFCSYNIQHCFICRPSDSTVPTDAGIEPRGGMHSQVSYWFSIGFKQMVCTVATCYWFLVLLWFYKTRSFLSLEHYNRVPHCPKFFLFILTIIFSQYSRTY